MAALSDGQPAWGPWIRSERERRGLTRDELADRIAAEFCRTHPMTHAGVTGKAVRNWENGRHRPSPGYRAALRALFGPPPFERAETAGEPAAGPPSTSPAAAGEIELTWLFDTDWGLVPERVEEAAHALHRAVRGQWRAEAAARQLLDPGPLAVRWGPADPPAGAPGPSVAGSTRDMPCLAAAFARQSGHRLVVLGAPGTGKTTLAILLTLELLEQRAAGLRRRGATPTPVYPIPVLLSAAAWEPEREHLHDYVDRQLREEYPVLRAYGSDVAEQLRLCRQILPVIDGLDELPAARRGAAIRRVLTTDGWLVVTCRTAEFSRAVESTGGPLPGAAVVVPEPAAPADVADYLAASTPPDRRSRWQPLLDELGAPAEAAPGAGSLRSVLSVPLMVSLTRAVHAAPAADPSGLVDLARRRDRTAVEDHLLAALVPALLATEGDRPRRGRRAGAWEPVQVERWLTFLAAHLDRLGTRDLAWWHLHRAVPGPRRRLAMVLGVAALTALATGVKWAVLLGALSGLLNGLQSAFGRSLVTALALRLAPAADAGPGGRPAPRRPGRTADGLRALATAGVVLAASGLLLAALRHDPYLSAMVATQFAIMYGLVTAAVLRLVRAPAAALPGGRWARHPAVRVAAGGSLFLLALSGVYTVSGQVDHVLYHRSWPDLVVALRAELVSILGFLPEGLAAGFLVAFTPSGTPTQAAIGLRGRGRALVAWVLVGLAMGIPLGAYFGLSNGLTAPSGAAPDAALRQVLASLSVNPFWSALAGPPAVTSLLAEDSWPWRTSLASQLVAGLGACMLIGAGLGILRWTQTPIAVERAPGPRATLRADRTLTVGYALAIALAATLVAEPVYWSPRNLVYGAEFGVYYALLFLVLRPWPAYLGVRLWLALRGRLPWRLMTFLEDMHRLGVLRQFGGVYQFRHSRLQDHLVGSRPRT